MFNSPVLDLVILLSFTYFIGSLILAAINEAIAGTFRLRQYNLRQAFNVLFFSPSWRIFIRNYFLKSPHIQSLMRSKGKFPAYIPAKNFVLSIFEHLDVESYKNGIIQTKFDNGSHILPTEVIKVLETIMIQVNHLEDKDKGKEFERRLEEFYDLSMDRVTGRYKRKIRGVLLITAIILSIILNLDTIRIINDALADKNQLAKSVEHISANISKVKDLNDKTLVVKDSNGVIKIEESFKKAEGAIIMFEQSAGYKIGYTSLEDFKKYWADNVFIKIIGVLLTAFALQLGSNYWFDLMNKAVNVRAVGMKPTAEKDVKQAHH